MNTKLIETSSLFPMKVKLELHNSGGSHKARAARYMINEAIKTNKINSNKDELRLIEKSGGNMAIGLAYAALSYGLKVDIVIPPSYNSATKRKRLQALGARLVGEKEMLQGKTAAEVISEYTAKGSDDGRDYIYLDQFHNKAGINAHFYETGTEITDQINQYEGIDDIEQIYFVAGIGTGASITGISRKLQESFPDRVKTIAIQPEGCDYTKGTFTDHSLYGIGVPVEGGLPPLLNMDLIDDFHSVTPRESEQGCKYLLHHYGFWAGPSTGANISVATQLIKNIQKYKPQKKFLVVTLAYDSGDDYTT